MMMTKQNRTQWALGSLAAVTTIITATIIPYAVSSEARITKLERRSDVQDNNYAHIKESLARIENRLDNL